MQPSHVDSADQTIRLGLSRQHAGDLHGAAECFKQAIALDPSSSEAYNNLASLFASLKDWDTALIFTRTAAELNPHSAKIQSNLALLYLKQGQILPAIEHYRKAAALDATDPTYPNFLGNALRLTGQSVEAEASIRHAIEMEPNYAEAYVNLGYLYYEQLKPASLVEDLYRSAISHAPDLAQAHVNLSHCLLRRGAFAEGWAEHEWRWQWKDFPSPKRNFTQPQWKGEPIQGARILLHAEQGFGDTLQFLRYVPMVAKRGANIILEVHPELHTLTADSIQGIQIISRGDPLPEFDWHCPLLSLPLAFGTEMQNIPASIPYVSTQAEAPAWLTKQHPADLHVGLVWAGSASNVIDRSRSLSLTALEALWQIKGVSFYSLQRGSTRVDPDSAASMFAASLPPSGDFAATAAAISHLDLIVSVDTSVAHLAGALGKPVWIMLPVRSDWRWLTARDDSPWYPTAKLFRQTSDGDWDDVVARVAAELASLALERTSQGDDK